MSEAKLTVPGASPVRSMVTQESLLTASCTTPSNAGVVSTNRAATSRI